MQHEILMNVTFHFNNLEKYSMLNDRSIKKSLESLFMYYRNDFSDIFNAKIDDINKAWDETGKPCSFGDYAEDINPEYSKFIRDRLDDDFDRHNKELFKNELCPLVFYLNDYCDIRAHLNVLPDVNIWITLEEMK